MVVSTREQPSLPSLKCHFLSVPISVPVPATSILGRYAPAVRRSPRVRGWVGEQGLSSFGVNQKWGEALCVTFRGRAGPMLSNLESLLVRVSQFGGPAGSALADRHNQVSYRTG